jgi:hypothetical protein
MTFAGFWTFSPKLCHFEIYFVYILFCFLLLFIDFVLFIYFIFSADFVFGSCSC